MRHRKHNQQLGVKRPHRAALLSNMAASLFLHGRIRTTLAKAKALRPFTEKVITMAKKARESQGTEKALHYRRQALSKVRDQAAVHLLFHELVDQFMDRNGGYTRIYKLAPRQGDAADMALIELIPASDEGYSKRRKPGQKKAAAKKSEEKQAEPTAEAADEAVAPEAATDADTSEDTADVTDQEKS